MKQRNEGELKVVEFCTDHLRQLAKPLDNQVQITEIYIDQFRKTLESQPKQESYTAVNQQGQPVFCFGGWWMRPEVVDLWFIGSVRVIRYPRSCYQICRRYIDDRCFHMGAQRVQAAVRCGWGVAEEFMFRLGFQIEDRLRKADGENDYYLFARMK